MRRLLLRTAAGLCLASLLGLASASGAELGGKTARGGKPIRPTPGTLPVIKPKPGCGGHGTQIDFVATPSEAARRAKKEEKLVFVLHVSGHFEDPRFT